MMHMVRILVAGAVFCAAAAAAPAADIPTLTQAEQQRAQVNYLINCAGCHLPDGHGAPGTVPDLREYLGAFAQHPASRSFIARVPGAAGSPLNDRELAEVLNWILITMNGAQLRPGFRLYTETEVAGYRGDILIDVVPVRQALIRTLAGNAE